MKTLNGIFLPFSRLRLSDAPNTSELCRSTVAKKASNKKLHLDIESLLNSIYLLQANTERLDFSTKFFLEVAKLPFEFNLVPKKVHSGVLTI